MTFNEVTNKLEELYNNKNSDYGNSFKNTYDLFGIVAPLVRINDKVNRLNTLLTTPAKVKDEKIIDTLQDLANYTILTLMHYKNENSSQVN